MFQTLCDTYAKTSLSEVKFNWASSIFLLAKSGNPSHEISTTIKIKNISITPKSLIMLCCKSFFSLPTLLLYPKQPLTALTIINLHFLQFYVNDISKVYTFFCLASYTKHNYF